MVRGGGRHEKVFVVKNILMLKIFYMKTKSKAKTKAKNKKQKKKLKLAILIST